jgi:hypothetical protein
MAPKNKPTAKHGANAPMEYRAQLDSKSEPGEWRGRYVPVKKSSKPTRAEKTLAKYNAPLQPWPGN